MSENTKAILFLSGLFNEPYIKDFFSARTYISKAIDALVEKEYLDRLISNQHMINTDVYLTDTDEIFHGKIVDRLGSVYTIKFDDPELDGPYSIYDFLYKLSFTEEDARAK